MSFPFIKFGFLFLVLSFVAEADAVEKCNPVVAPIKSNMSTAMLLADLANKYNFSLSFPKSMDQPVQADDAMELNRLIKILTSGMNTVLRHERVEGCTHLRLTELTVLPVGDETDFINAGQKPVEPPVGYIFIGDMEQYVMEVLKRERKAEVKKMTPEQAVEFKIVKKRLKKELKAEKKLNKSKKKKGKKKARKAETDTDIAKNGAGS